MMKDVNDIRAWIETANCFEVMGQLRKQGVFTKADLKKAMKMTREQWLNFMMEKVGLAPRTEHDNGRLYGKHESKEI